MIIFFGPVGAGKSVQGQILAARHGWRWLSTGQLLRDTHDADVLKKMTSGELIDDETTNKVLIDALQRSEGISRVVLDGYPRELSQAEWLMDNLSLCNRSIELVVVLEVPESEVLRRLSLRGRIDDTPETIKDRLHIFRDRMYPILDYLNQNKIRIIHIDGTGTVGQVHDRVEAELEACSLV